MVRLICTVVVLVLLSSWSTAGDARGTMLTEKDNNKKVKLDKGSVLSVRLAGNPTTGFQWVIDKNDKQVLSPQGKPEYKPEKKGVIGGGGHFTFRFKAEQAGTSDLVLEYKRPFEKDKEPAKTFKVSVTVD